MASHLRLFPVAEPSDKIEAQPASVQVTLGELLPLVALAHRHNFLWLRDFLDDEVSITEDLYEVLRAFRSHRPSA